MITNELVAMRLMIGVTGFKANPAAMPARPVKARIENFRRGGRALISSCPARTPQIVWAAVGMALNDTQCPADSSPEISMSTHEPKLWSGTNGWLKPGAAKVR